MCQTHNPTHVHSSLDSVNHQQYKYSQTLYSRFKQSVLVLLLVPHQELLLQLPSVTDKHCQPRLCTGILQSIAWNISTGSPLGQMLVLVLLQLLP